VQIFTEAMLLVGQARPSHRGRKFSNVRCCSDNDQNGAFLECAFDGGQTAG
jgi:hypothetical protein